MRYRIAIPVAAALLLASLAAYGAAVRSGQTRVARSRKPRAASSGRAGLTTIARRTRVGGETRLVNHDRRGYKWVMSCAKGGTTGTVPAGGVVRFVLRSGVPGGCRLHLHRPKSKRAGSVRLTPGGRLRILRGSLTALHEITVLYPPIPVMGARRLAGSPMLARMWASSARASSEWNTTSYSAAQAIGPANVHHCGDSVGSWATKLQNRGREWLEVGFPRKVRAIGAIIHANWSPGAVVRIKARTGGGWETVWSGKDPTRGTCPVVFAAPFSEPLDTNKLRIILDTRKVAGWNEIDAVRLVYRPAPRKS